MISAAFGGIAEAAERPFVVLASSQIKAYQDAVTGVREGLQGHRVVTYSLEGNPNRIPYVVNQISLLSPKVVIAVGGLAVLALDSRSVDAKVVACLAVDDAQVLDPSRSWVVSMYAAPREIYARFQEFLPHHRIGIPHHPERTGPILRPMMEFFEQTPIRLVPIVVRSPGDLAAALSAARADIDALWIVPDSSFLDELSIKYLLRYSVVERLPLIGYSDWFARSGGLFSLMPDYRDLGIQAGELASRINAGEHPSHLQFARNVKTFINLRVAKQLRIPISPSLAALANRVYP
ncbi:MAG: ABC transporter substrate binding protein [Nitrospirota bacterium]